MDSDLSFYKEFGYTHNYTFEFYSTQDGNVHYEVFVNNEKEFKQRFSLSHMATYLDSNLDSKFSHKCD